MRCCKEREVGGWGRDPFSRNFIEWYSTPSPNLSPYIFLGLDPSPPPLQRTTPCAAVCCNMSQCVARKYIKSHPASHSLPATECAVESEYTVCCSVLQYVAVCCIKPRQGTFLLQCVAVCCSVLQCVAVCCIKVHHAASYIPQSARYRVAKTLKNP